MMTYFGLTLRRHILVYQVKKKCVAFIMDCAVVINDIISYIMAHGHIRVRIQVIYCDKPRTCASLGDAALRDIQ